MFSSSKGNYLPKIDTFSHCFLNFLRTVISKKVATHTKIIKSKTEIQEIQNSRVIICVDLAV